MLAAMDPQQRADYLDKAGLQRWAPATICDREVLVEHLEHVRQSQLALDINEFQLGLACMAVPVHDQAGGVAGSVAISLPVPEFRARRWTVERAVRQGAARITRSLVLEGRGRGSPGGRRVGADRGGGVGARRGAGRGEGTRAAPGRSG